ncbi:MAG: hypothetical protein GX241_06990 [Ruminococcaceae bacterium]|nr:hypothetical protein [Oscillospiraceae bacterium]
MIFSFTGCVGNGVITKASEIKIIMPTDVNKKYHTSNENTVKSLIKSGLYELYLDESNFAIALKDTSGTLWYALPSTGDKDAAMLVIEVTDGKTTYILNSQDNSVAFGKAKFEAFENGINFNYVFQEKEKEPTFKIPVSLALTLEDGKFDATVDTSTIRAPKGYQVSKISIMPYFGAVTSAKEGDYIVIPDGCGALINLVEAEDSTYVLDTYGADFAVKDSNEHPSIFGMFGIKNGANAFAGIITEGDALSKIHAKTLKHGPHIAYASFDITPNANFRDKFVLADETFEGKIGVTYKFISGSATTYSGLAFLTSEQFIRAGLLSTRLVSSETELPLNITLIGCMNKAFGNTIAYTTFENAENIVSVLKAKGINSINLKYDGALGGGLRQRSIGSVGFAGKLGNKKEFESLKNYHIGQDFDLYVTLNMISSTSHGRTATGTISNSVEIKFPNELQEYIVTKTFDFKGLTAKDLPRNVVSFMNKMNKYDVPGYCIEDAGKVIFSDLSNGFTDRQTFSKDIFTQAIALSTNKNLMVTNGNLYALKNANIISELPITTSYQESEAYERIPFVQMVLHGTVEYTSDYLNLAKDYDTLLLRLIEYGALPAFKFTFVDYVPKGAESSILYYGNYTAIALDAYNTFNLALGDLRSAKMTNHYKIQEGLFCTEYNNETYIYVNYTDSDIMYRNLTIKAKSYLRVN